MHIDDLDTLLFTLKDRVVRKVFIDEAISLGHFPSDARNMYKLIVLELTRNYSDLIKQMAKEIS